MDPAKAIHRVGDKLIRCSEKCKGIERDANEGILPRCLYYDQGKKGALGAVVVGINPARADVDERFEYMETRPSYDAVVEYWEDELRDKNLYYRRLSWLLRQLGVRGSILWTELVKCQKSDAAADPPLETFRKCAHKYLRREIESIPRGWPVFAIGNRAFNALLYMFPGRAIVGVPHPTNSRGQFQHLHASDGSLLHKYRDQARSCYKHGRRDAVWLKVSQKKHAR